MMVTLKWGARAAASMMVMLGLFVTSSAMAQQVAPAILYSYTKVSVGNDIQPVLMPKAARKTKIAYGSKLSPAIVNGVFKELRKDKSTTYGDTSLDVDARSMAKGQATVKLDKGREKYFAIITSEIVYTLSQLGINKVSFPGYSKKPMTRADVQFAAFRLTIPAWRALPPKVIPASIIIMPDGSEMKSEAYAKKIAAKDPQIVSILETYLKGKDKSLVQTSIRAVVAMKLPNAADLLLPLLKNKDADLRISALDALAGNDDQKVLDAISTVMDKDRDKKVALKASEILGKSKNKKYSVRALYFALRGDDEAASIKAIGALAASKEPTVAPELVKAARGKRDKVAEAAISALNDLKLTTELVTLFGDKKLAAARRLQSAALVAAGKDKAAAFKANAFQATAAKGDVALKSLEALSKSKDPDPRTAIEAALAHPEQAVRHDAAKRLAAIKNPESLNALAKAGTRPEDAEVIQDASSKIMATLTLTDVLKYTSNRNIVLRRVAYRALGVKGGNSKAVFTALTKGIADKDAGIRAASALALGSFKNDKALKAVMGASKDKDALVRRNVARALGNWDKGTQTDTLLGYLSDKEGGVVEAAVASLHQRREEVAYKPILQLTRGAAHPHAGVRKATLRALVDLTPAKEMQTVISVLSGGLFDKDREVKILAIDLLGRYSNPAAVTGLAALINDPVEEYRVRSLLALGSTGSKDAVELIASVLKDKSVPVRKAAMEALGNLGISEGIEPIKTRLAVEQEIEVIKAGEAALKKLR